MFSDSRETAWRKHTQNSNPQDLSWRHFVCPVPQSICSVSLAPNLPHIVSQTSSTISPKVRRRRRRGRAATIRAAPVWRSVSQSDTDPILLGTNLIVPYVSLFASRLVSLFTLKLSVLLSYIIEFGRGGNFEVWEKDLVTRIEIWNEKKVLISPDF